MHLTVLAMARKFLAQGWANNPHGTSHGLIRVPVVSTDCARLAATLHLDDDYDDDDDDDDEGDEGDEGDG